VTLDEGNVARTIALWLGGLIGDRLLTSPTDAGGVFGFLGGISAFACLRLWLATPPRAS
jgi:hypothetical protein